MKITDSNVSETEKKLEQAIRLLSIVKEINPSLPMGLMEDIESLLDEMLKESKENGRC